MIEIYTDGSCLNNPGPGGWAILIRKGDKERVVFGGEASTTNNRMELMAVLYGLRSFGEEQEISIFTDSQYIQRGMTEWLPRWKKNHWKNSQKEEVKNRDLWEALDRENQRHKVKWHWIKGHKDNSHNIRVDKLAGAAMKIIAEGI